MSMNIYALKGYPVRVTERSIKNGTKSDKDKAKQYLTVGGEYVVERTNVGDWHTDVTLQEFPDVEFNVVQFEEVDKQSHELNMQHPQHPEHYKHKWNNGNE